MRNNLKQLWKVLFMFLFFLNVYFAIPVSAAELEALPENAIAIQSPEELAMICNEYPADGYYYLSCDIDMTEILSEYGDMYYEGAGWEPVGTTSVPFSGTFDGRGYKIVGLKINRTTANVGLFGYADGAAIKNLIIEDGTVNGTTYTAMILGKGNNTVLTGCVINGGTVSSTSTYVAGLAGAMTGASGTVLQQCSNSASVTGTKYVAGVVGSVSGTDYILEACSNSGDVVSTEGGYCGGVAGDALSGTIMQSVNDGSVEVKNVQSFVAGGIAGRAETVRDCTNNGKILGDLWWKYQRDTFPIPSASYLGGIVGVATLGEECVNAGTIVGDCGGYSYLSGNRIYSTHTHTYTGGIGAKVNTISNSYNCGMITGCSQSAGAISGSNTNSTIKNCYSVNAEVPLAAENSSVSLINCYNVDGIIASSGTATNCFYYAEEESGIGSLRTKRQLRIKSTFTDWDFENVWTMEGNEDYLYPELIGMEPSYKKSLVSISMAALPDKTTYLEQKETLDLTGAQLRLTYDNETTEKITITEEMVSGFDNTVIGQNTITVSYQAYKVTFDVTIIAKSLSSIEVTTLPDKLEYLEAKDTLDVTGGVLTLYYNNDTAATKELTAGMVSGFDNTIVGPQELTVTYSGKTTTYNVEIIEKALVEIAVTELPTKTSYIEAKEALDLTGGKLTLYYDNDQTKVINLSEAVVTGFNNKKVGIQTLSAYYQGLLTEFQIEIAAKSVSYIILVSEPTTLSYLESKDKLDTSGGQIRIIYNNDTEETIAMTVDMVSGFDNTVVGTQVLTVTYGGKTTAYEVEVIAKSLTGIALKDKPAKLTYREHKDILDVTGGKITLIYNNDTTADIDMAKSMVSGFDNTTIGIQTLTVSYKGYTITYDVEILQKRLVSIDVTTLPEKLTYLEAKENLDVSGGKLTLYYDNDSQEIIDMTEVMVSGFDNTKPGVQTLNVSYGEKKTTFDVEIIAKQLVSVAVESMPNKLTYEEGEMLDLTGGKILLSYNNGQSISMQMNDEMISGFDSSKGGMKTLTITYGGKKAQIEIQVLHAYGETITEPTCTEQGYTTYLCAGCGDSYVDSYTQETGHNYKESVTTPTCTEVGYTTHTCEKCRDSYLDNEEEALGHDLGAWETVKEAGCTETGEKERGCSRCDYKEAGEIPANGHSYETVVTEPTCEEEGYSTHTCKVCGDSYVDSEEEALGHDLSAWETLKEAGCTETGEKERGCSRCDYSESEEIPPNGHSYETVVTAPTCEEEGYSTNTCKACGDSYVDSEEEALGHDLSAWETVKEAGCTETGEKERGCSRCDYSENEEIPAKGHSYETVVTEPTCEEEGYSTHTCKVCGDNYVDSKEEALGHDLGAWETVKEAGCLEIGEKERGCSRCDYSENEEIPAKGHSYETVVTEPTCEEEGYSTHTCKACGDSYVDGEEEALGHSFTNYISDGNATADSMGTKTAKCDCCDVTDTVADPTSGIPVIPGNGNVTRIFGATRYETSYKVADVLKAKMGVEKFDAVIVATGKNFADALAGSYLAVRKEAPILLTNGKADNIAQLHSYIRENVVEGGVVYILGGEGAVPASVEEIKGYDVIRLSGPTRYDTNLEILAEAGVVDDAIIVATGKSFADSLSASAAKLPILLVKPGSILNDEQKAIIEDMNDIYIIGGDGAVGAAIAAELSVYGDVVRVSGKTRYETSVAVANTFFENVEEAVVASGKNFPDGLCGGALAAAMDAPLILTADGKAEAAADYLQSEDVSAGYVLGGTGALSDETVMEVFHLGE